MSMTVPMQAPGSKSLPAQMRTNHPGAGSNGFARLQAQHPGYPQGGYPAQPMSPVYKVNLGAMGRHRGMRGLRGMGDTGTGGTSVYTPPSVITPVDIPVDISTMTPTDLQDLFGTGATASQDTAAAQQIAALNPPAGLYSGPTSVAPGAATPAAPSGYQWANLVNSSGQTLAKVLAISQGGSAVTLPNGAQLIYGSATASAAGSVSGLLNTSVAGIPLQTILVVGGGLLLVMMLMEGGGRR